MSGPVTVQSHWSPLQARHVTAATVRCARCDAIDTVPLTGNFSPEWAQKRLTARGWTFTRRTATCPQCGRSHHKDMPMTTQTPAAAPKAQPAATRPAPAVPETAALVINTPTPQHRLRVRALLDEHFDDLRGCYIDNYSDERIAKETQIAPAIVAAIREAAYGPLKPQPSEADIERGRAAAAISDKLAAFDRAVKDLTSAIQRLLAAIGEETKP